MLKALLLGGGVAAGQQRPEAGAARRGEVMVPSAGGARGSRAALLFRRGRAAVARGDRVSALGYLADALRANPQHAAAYLLLGQLYLEAGRLDDAAAVAEAGLARRPDESTLWLLHARVLEAAGRAEEALATLRRLCQRLPDSIAGHRARAALAQELGRFSEALAAERALLRIASEDAALAPEERDTLRAEAAARIAALRLLSAELDPLQDCEGALGVRAALCARGL